MWLEEHVKSRDCRKGRRAMQGETLTAEEALWLEERIRGLPLDGVAEDFRRAFGGEAAAERLRMHVTVSRRGRPERRAIGIEGFRFLRDYLLLNGKTSIPALCAVYGRRFGWDGSVYMFRKAVERLGIPGTGGLWKWHRWTAEEDDDIRRFRAAGCSWDEVARSFNRKRGTNYSPMRIRARWVRITALETEGGKDAGNEDGNGYAADDTLGGARDAVAEGADAEAHRGGGADVLPERAVP
jgi:hypothetical protein